MGLRGFDEVEAIRFFRLYCAALCAFMLLFFALLAILTCDASERWSALLFVLVFFGPLCAINLLWVPRAACRHLKMTCELGNVVEGHVTGKRWILLSSGLPRVRVEVRDPGEGHPRLLWCFALPSQWKRLRKGDVVRAADGSRLMGWAPRWALKGCLLAPQHEAGGVGLSSEELPRTEAAEQARERTRELVAEIERAHRQWFMLIGLLALPVALASLVLAAVFNELLIFLGGPAAGAIMASCAWGVRLRIAQRRAVRRFDALLPLGSAERDEALRALRLWSDYSAAAKRMRKALKRS